MKEVRKKRKQPEERTNERKKEKSNALAGEEWMIH
jgi:hypothetical protein